MSEHEEDRGALLAFAERLNKLGEEFPHIHLACAMAVTRDTQAGGAERVEVMVGSQVNGRAAVLRFAVREMLRELDDAQAPADAMGEVARADN